MAENDAPPKKVTPPAATPPKVRPGLAGVESNLPSVAPIDPDKPVDNAPDKSVHFDPGVNPIPTSPGVGNTSRITGGIYPLPLDGKPRYVRALARSYLHGVIVEPGEVSLWPTGVEELGPNLEEYKFPGQD